MRSAGRHVERGFSLIELMVAMTATLIVSGAVYGLVVAGSSAFRREPAVADRQQNIRVALDLIAQDLFQAGTGVPELSQVFTRNLDKTGPAMGSGGELADQLELIRSTDCPYLTVCKDAGDNLFTVEPIPDCYQLPASIMIGCDTGNNCPTYDLNFGFERGAPDQTMECKNGHVNMPHGLGQAPALNPPGGKRPFSPQWIAIGNIVRYRINLDAAGIPNLERSLYGGANDFYNNSSWEILSRGVEDLQVQYETATGAGGALVWSDDPGATSTADTLVRRVRVRLSARVTEGGRMTGETSAVGLPNIQNAIRGQLSTEVAPRAAMATLARAHGEL